MNQAELRYTRYIGDWAQRLGVEGVWQAVRERGEGK